MAQGLTGRNRDVTGQGLVAVAAVVAERSVAAPAWAGFAQICSGQKPDIAPTAAA
jgi:hypothetical protein